MERGTLRNCKNWGHLYGKKFCSLGYFKAVKNRQGGRSHVKGKGLRQPKGLFSKRQCQCNNSAEGLQVHGGQGVDYSPVGEVAVCCKARGGAARGDASSAGLQGRLF